MADSERVPALDSQSQQIRWSHFNYPPLIRIIHFSPKEIPKDKRFIVLSLFIIHLIFLFNCFLNFIDNCIEGGLGILYSILILLIFNPLILLLFYRAYTGICKDKSNLKLYIIIQPIMVVLEVIFSVVNFLGLNGFIRVNKMFDEGRHSAAVLGLIVSLIFLSIAVYSSFIFVRIVRERKELTANL